MTKLLTFTVVFILSVTTVYLFSSSQDQSASSQPFTMTAPNSVISSGPDTFKDKPVPQQIQDGKANDSQGSTQQLTSENNGKVADGHAQLQDDLNQENNERVNLSSTTTKSDASGASNLEYLLSYFAFAVPSDDVACDSSSPWNDGEEMLQELSGQPCFALKFEAKTALSFMLLEVTEQYGVFALLSPNCKSVGFSSAQIDPVTPTYFPRSVDKSTGLMTLSSQQPGTQYYLIAASSDDAKFNTLTLSVNNACGQEGSLKAQDLEARLNEGKIEYLRLSLPR